MEELKSKPSLKDIKMRPLIQKQDKMHLDKEDKDTYMWTVLEITQI